MRDTASAVDRELDRLGHDLDARAEHARSVVGARLFAERRGDRSLRGRYRWIRPLGGGGQGQVWAAHDTRLDREVAIKFVRSDVRSSVVANKWLQHEARALARVRHPRVVHVFDVLWASAQEIAAVGMAVDSAVACIVMELVHGRTMTAWVRERRRSEAEILRVGADVLEGLAAIHAAGLVHCDIKPGNVIIADDGSIKIADLGVARLHRAIEAITHDGAPRSDADHGSDRERTTVEPVGGTPRYMPPEQLEGARVDARADQYALAVTLFEALFGAAPHDASGALRLLEDKRGGPPACPDPARCPRASWAALCRALAAAPEDRHDDAAAFRAALGVRMPRGRKLALAIAIAAGAGLVLAATGRAEPVECADAFALDPREAAGIVEAIESEGSTFAAQTSTRVLARLRDHERRLLDAREQLCGAASPPALALRCLERATIATRSAVHVLGEPQPHLALLADDLVAKLPSPTACIDGTAPVAVDEGVPVARACDLADAQPGDGARGRRADR